MKAFFLSLLISLSALANPEIHCQVNLKYRIYAEEIGLIAHASQVEKISLKKGEDPKDLKFSIPSELKSWTLDSSKEWEGLDICFAKGSFSTAKILSQLLRDQRILGNYISVFLEPPVKGMFKNYGSWIKGYPGTIKIEGFHHQELKGVGAVTEKRNSTDIDPIKSTIHLSEPHLEGFQCSPEQLKIVFENEASMYCDKVGTINQIAPKT
jgi:hypothetical protein